MSTSPKLDEPPQELSEQDLWALEAADLPTPLTEPNLLPRPDLHAESLGSRSFVPGEHRVVVHMREGLVKRGILRNADMEDGTVRLESETGVEFINTDAIKAVFFMSPPGKALPNPNGTKLRVSFRDGRSLIAFAIDPQPDDTGFFMVPPDSQRTNTARIYVYRNAIKEVTPG